MLVNKNLDIILASKSPRRRELLSQIGIEYRCVTSDKPEVISSSVPQEVVVELACQKARDVFDQVIDTKEMNKDMIIIGADTVVAYDGNILGKPKDVQDAKRMLKMLSGKHHQVFTGVDVIYKTGEVKKEINFFECSDVYVSELTEVDIDEYVSTGEPMDKAGSYGIQGIFGKYVTGIKGDYNNIVGLPVSALYRNVREQLGIDLCNCTIKKHNKVKACIFDLDGTTLDTVESIGSTVNLVLKELGLKEHSIPEYKRFAGDGQIELIKRALKASGDAELKNFDRAMESYIELFKTRCTYNVKPYDGIREAIDLLKNNGIKVCIFSNKQHDNVMSILDDLFGKDYFDFVLGQRDDHKKKPSSEGLDIILKGLGVNKDDCVYVGDTDTDMKTGKYFGLYTIGVTWGFRSKDELIEENCDYLIDTPMELVGKELGLI